VGGVGEGADFTVPGDTDFRSATGLGIKKKSLINVNYQLYLHFYLYFRLNNKTHWGGEFYIQYIRVGQLYSQTAIYFYKK
jgi:hypothetical protein